MKTNFKPVKDANLDLSIGVNVNFQKSGDVIYATFFEEGMPNRTVVSNPIVGTPVEKDGVTSKFLRAVASSAKYSSKYFRENKDAS